MKRIDYPVPVYLFGGEGTGWALDADVETTRQSLLALPELVRLTSREEAAVIHSVWEYPLLHMDPVLLDGKRIVCHVCNDLMRTYEAPCMVNVGDTLGLWIAISRTAEKEIRRLGFNSAYIPYSVDTSLFTETVRPETLTALRREYNIPKGAFLISSFMRDSSGADLKRPKEQKGVELFVAIVVELKRKGCPVHILLAGPRRHWLISQLRRHNVPYTYIGREVEEDDNTINILKPEQINQLYHLSDLHLVTSRWEGGPRAVLEAAATKTPIFCTPVGMAPDVLDADCLITGFDDAVTKIMRAIISGRNHKQLSDHFDRINKYFTPAANVERFRKVYEEVGEVRCFERKNVKWQTKNRTYWHSDQERPLIYKLLNFFSSSLYKQNKNKISISLWHEYHKPPYGGGNQFMMALKKAFERNGVSVVVNKLHPSVDVHICNSAWFDVHKFQAQLKEKSIKMVHRIDGPITFYRGEGSGEDNRIFEINSRFASATVFQSAFSFFKLL
jgi:glycosyltransferase involved in cell wall biosynthesis